MKTSAFLSFAAASAMLWAACEPIPKSQEPAQPAPSLSQVPDAANSRNSIDWAGTYKGTTPCADCEGIETSITLYSDGSYRRTLQYLGKEEDNFFSEEGNFEWDDAGGKVSIKSMSGTQQYQVGEHVLFHLDQDGSRISGGLEAMYRLAKNYADPRVESKKWQLVELRGNPVLAADNGKIPTLEFNAVEGSLAGNDGCNQVMGGYTLNEGNRISFGQMAGTLMACPDMQTPEAFRSTLEMVDNYTVNDTSFVLNRARMAPLARFAPVL